MPMQFVTPQSNLTLNWSLQSALTAGICVACAGVAITFKRPAMRALAYAFVCISTAAASIWLSLALPDWGFSTMVSSLFIATGVALTPFIVFLFYLQIIGLLSGKPVSAMPSPRRLAVTAALAFVAALSIGVFGEIRSPGRPIILAILGTVGTVIASAVMYVLAGRAAKIPGVRRGPLRMLQVSFAAFAVRSALNVAVSAVAARTGDTPHFPTSVVLAQVFLIVVAGVLQLTAVLDEERAQGVRQAEQLKQAELSMAASQRFESLGRMAGAVAHDFNNILTVITMSAHSVLDAVKGAPRQAGESEEELGEVIMSAARGKALTEQLLAFARRAPQKVTRFDVRAQLENLRGLLERVAGQLSTLKVDQADSMQLVDMDVTQMEQVVMNLVLNARDAMPMGGVISVSTGSGAPDHTGATPVRITVADTGPGIPPEVIDRIFEPFFSTKRAGEGTGLGLAICESIVRGAGGRIDVHSEAGKGTRFDVLLPRAVEV